MCIPRIVSAINTATVMAAIAVADEPTWPLRWRYVELTPEGATASIAWSNSAAQQAGQAFIDGEWRAGIWSGSPASWSSLSPTTNGVVYSIAGGQQAGNRDNRACLWYGTPDSWIDLQPDDASVSIAFDTDGMEQGGIVRLQGLDGHAALWRGSRDSFIDLHPSTITSRHSGVWGVAGGQQVGSTGWLFSFDRYRAAMWHGTPESYIDLTPSDASEAVAYDTNGTQQVGYAVLDPPYYRRALIWNAAPDNVILLTPSGLRFDTEARSITADGAYQAGNYGTAGACAWNSSSSNRVDLHALLPSEYSESKGLSVSRSGRRVHVVGYGLRENHARALLWIGGLCREDIVPDGRVDVRDLEGLLAYFGETDPGPTNGDIDDDGDVDLADLARLLAEFGQLCP
ncbi:MAG: hypothetical protein IT450_05690 [Phycisphaerales bacterium]|nr:hypothetical protein [Phycisphaerales bacterium]